MNPIKEIRDYRMKTIQSVLLFLVPFLALSAYLRLTEAQDALQSRIDLGLAAAALGSLLLIRRFPGLYGLLSRLILLTADLAFLLVLHTLQGASSVLLWGLSLVLLSFLLRGRHEGWFWSLLIVAGPLILGRVSQEYMIHMDNFTLLSFLGNAVLVAFCASWYEFLAEKELERVRNERERLESLVRHRTRSLNDANAKAMEALKKAQDASEAKSTFLANVSHEIRTPLNAINGFISMMLKDETHPEKRRQLQTIHEASEILTRLISDILDLSKIESGNMELHFSDFDPRQLFFSVSELYQSRAKEKHLTMIIDFCADGDPVSRVHSDPMRIRQVLNNLLSNAVKFTPEGGQIVVSGCYRDGWLSFTVEDTGVGMTPADQERIFRPFQQARNQPDGNIRGTGLGLAISREIAQRLQGTLELRSIPGVGSTFTFTLPAPPAKSPARQTPAPAAATPAPLPQRLDAELLIVEDIRANQMFLTMVLNRYGIRYDIANDGIEAVEKCREKRYDLILMDENMPRMNGREATAEIRRMERERHDSPVPIIALTANAVAGDRERLIAAGMSEYISKPVDPDHLIRTIAALLEEARGEV